MTETTPSEEYGKINVADALSFFCKPSKIATIRNYFRLPDGKRQYDVTPVSDIHPSGRWIVHSIPEIRTLYGGGYCVSIENLYAIHLIDNHGQIYTARFDTTTTGDLASPVTTWECLLDLIPDESYAQPLPHYLIDFCKKFDRYPFNAGPHVSISGKSNISGQSSAIRDLAEKIEQEKAEKRTTTS